MSKFETTDLNSSFKLSLHESLVANGRKSFCFEIEVSSHGFHAKVLEIWLEEDEITTFIENLHRLVDGGFIQAKLIAMSDAKINVLPRDGQGHFKMQFDLSNGFYGNSASLVVDLETQALIDLASFLMTQTGKAIGLKK